MHSTQKYDTRKYIIQKWKSNEKWTLDVFSCLLTSGTLALSISPALSAISFSLFIIHLCWCVYSLHVQPTRLTTEIFCLFLFIVGHTYLFETATYKLSRISYNIAINPPTLIRIHTRLQNVYGLIWLWVGWIWIDVACAAGTKRNVFLPSVPLQYDK